MRLKNININERSSTFNPDQKKCLKDMSSSINQIGEVFDNMVQLEDFIIQEIQDELSSLIGIRENKEKIVEEFGLQVYLNEYFKKAVYAIEEKITKSIDLWNFAKDRLSTNEIKGTIILLKEMSDILNKLGVTNYKSTAILNDLINEFGHFQLCKVIFTGDIVERINVLTGLKNEIVEVFSTPKNDEPKNPIERRKKLTIDDL